MKKLRTIIALALALAMGATSFSGCAKKEEVTAQASNTQEATAEENPVEDPIQISVGTWDINADNTDPAKDSIVAEICKKLNITIKPYTLTWDDFTQKIQVWAASDQLPDVFSGDLVGSKIRTNWITQGIIKALPQDLSKYPSLAKVFESPDIEALKTDGKQFCIPRQSFSDVAYTAMDRRLLYRWDWCQQLGITKEPETFDEFKAMLKAFIDKDPEGKKTTGLTLHQQVFISYFLLAYNPAALSGGNGNDFRWIKEDGKFIPAFISNSTLDGLKALKQLFDEGLIDKDIALIKTNEGQDKFYSGRAGAIVTNGYDQNKMEQIYQDKDPNEMVKTLKIWPAPDGNRYSASYRSYWSESYISGKVDDKKLDRILRLYDFLLSPEGLEMYRFGLEGKDYNKEGGKYTFLHEKPLGELYPSVNALRTLASWDGDNNYNPENPRIATNPKWKANTQFHVDFVNWSKENTKAPEHFESVMFLSTPEKDKFVLKEHDEIIKVLMSKKPVEQAWTDILKELEAKGLNKMIEEVNAEAAKAGIK